MLIVLIGWAVKAHHGAMASRRRNIRFADIELAARGDRRMVEMGLSEAFSTELLFAEARGDAAGKAHAGMGKQHSKAAAEDPAAKNTRSISSFFSS